MSVNASYLVHGESATEREAMDWNPELSGERAAFRPTSRSRCLVAQAWPRRSSVVARTPPASLSCSAVSGVQVHNDVVLNQVLVRFLADDGDHDERTRRVVEALQDDGTCWLGGSTWKGMQVMRISVSNWATTSEDVDRSVQAILRVAAGLDKNVDTRQLATAGKE